jgi:hypothetical protein
VKYCQYLLLADIKELGIKAKRFEYNELRIATKNFAKERKLGAGAYGVVYKVIKCNWFPKDLHTCCTTRNLCL